MAIATESTPPLGRPIPTEMQTPPRPDQPPIIAAFAPVPELDSGAYDRLARDVRNLLGIDLTQYKPAQMWRRVNCFAAARGLTDAAALVSRAQQDPVLRQAFLDMLTINVSEFFRNPDAWESLVKRFLAPMLRSQVPVRIWSAGCSLGYEPYTLAMLAREIAPWAPTRILATDLDETILSRARRAMYTEAQMAGVSERRRTRFFRRVEDRWQVRPEIGALVTFRRHDLLHDPDEKSFDLICCRNVVIYFTEPAKINLYRRFYDALRPNGILFLGATESIPNVRTIDLVPAGQTFYRRPSC
jgi:chemotaxis protein methyltransferase CheR